MRTKHGKASRAGGNAQETDAHGRALSGWAVLAIDGTTKSSTTSFAGPMVSSRPSVMAVH